METRSRVSGVHPDLWNRLARLQRVCDVRITSTFDGDLRTGWQVRATLRNSPGTPPLIIREAGLVRAMDELVHRVDAMGWLR